MDLGPVLFLPKALLFAYVKALRVSRFFFLKTSTQSRNCPSKRTNKKANQKQKSKNSKKNTQPKQKPNKNDERNGIATSNGNYMHDDILCVILRMAQNKKQNRTNPKHTKGPRWWVREA